MHRETVTVVAIGAGLVVLGLFWWLKARRARRLGTPLLRLRRRAGIEAYLGAALIILSAATLVLAFATRTATPLLPLAFLLGLASLLRGTADVGFWEGGFGSPYQCLPWERLRGYRWAGETLVLDVARYERTRLSEPPWTWRLRPGQRDVADAVLRARGFEGEG